MIEELATSSNNKNFFSNKHILTKSFADSQFTWPIQLVLKPKHRKNLIFTAPIKSILKLITEKIATSLNKDNSFSNKHNLTKFFAHSQFT